MGTLLQATGMGIVVLLYCLFPSCTYAALDVSSLVPCGNEIRVFEAERDGKKQICYADECSVCSVQLLIMKILNFLIVIMTGVAALLFAYAGALYASSPGNISNINKAHSVFLSTLVGMVIVLAAWLIVDTIMRALYAQDTKWGPWNDMLCKGVQPDYCVPKMEGLVAEPKQATKTCLEQGGQCRKPLDCMYVVKNGRQTMEPTGATVVNNTDCEKTTASVDNLHCCIPATAGDSCVMADNTKGVCGQMDTCSSTGEATSNCKNGLVCCPANATPPPPPTGNGSYDTNKITSQQARDMLRAAHVRMQNFDDGPPIEKGVINNIIAMNQACGGCVTVNSLSGGHETGGHVAGTKMDLSTRDDQGGPQLTQYITSTWEKMPDRGGAHGGPQYYSPMNGGVVCVKESSLSHWDCCNNHSKTTCN